MILEMIRQCSRYNFQMLSKRVVKKYSTSNPCKGLFSSIKDRFQKQREQHETDFQSWAEFEGRGFRKPEYMNSWIIEKYGLPQEVLKKDTINVHYEKFKSIDAHHSRLRQAVKNQCDVLVKIHAASINPIDVLMCQGYGKTLLNFRRNVLLELVNKFFTVEHHTEFPFVLGRDFSGTVVDVGSGVHDIVPGDEVYGTQELHKLGTLADFACVHLKGLCAKPATLSHVEAASLPYVSSTVLSALSGVTKNAAGKRALLLGGSGGIGTFTIQFLKTLGFHVSVSCSSTNNSLCASLGADCCYDYKSPNFEDEIKQDARFDVVFDNFGTLDHESAVDILNKNGTYITLKTPLVNYTDQHGLFMGVSTAASQYIITKIKAKNINVNWAYFSPNRSCLLHVAQLVDSGAIKPVIQEVLNFDDVPRAFQLVGSGKTKGKIVVNISGLPEATEKPNVDKIIHL